MSSVISYLRSGNVSTKPFVVRVAEEGAARAARRLAGRPPLLKPEAVAKLAPAQGGTVKGSVKPKSPATGKSYPAPLGVPAERAANATLGNIDEQRPRRGRK